MKRLLRKFVKQVQASLEYKANYPSLESFDDPLALEIDWTPLVHGGSNFTTHKLRFQKPGIAEFKASFSFKAFSLVFFAVGLVLLLWGVLNYNKTSLSDLLVIFLLVIGVGFSFSGLYLFRVATTKIVFDKSEGFFWKGRFGPREVPNKDSIKTLKRLSDIHALQIIAEEVNSSEQNYESFEINLILHSGERINLVDHGGYDQIIVDSVLLGEFLSVPIWPYLSQGIAPFHENQKPDDFN